MSQANIALHDAMALDLAVETALGMLNLVPMSQNLFALVLCYSLVLASILVKYLKGTTSSFRKEYGAIRVGSCRDASTLSMTFSIIC